jgi:hypothetical protein
MAQAEAKASKRPAQCSVAAILDEWREPSQVRSAASSRAPSPARSSAWSEAAGPPRSTPRDETTKTPVPGVSDWAREEEMNRLLNGSPEGTIEGARMDEDVEDEI